MSTCRECQREIVGRLNPQSQVLRPCVVAIAHGMREKRRNGSSWCISERRPYGASRAEGTQVKPCAVPECPALATVGDYCPVHRTMALEAEETAAAIEQRKRIARLYKHEDR
jgi:hypothetical protein